MPMYSKPSGLVKALNNRIMPFLLSLGLPLSGAHVLTVRGRKSGEPRAVTVNLLDHDGARYLVAPRGDTEWVRNLRAAGEGELRLGSKRDAFRATEIGDAEKPPVIRHYLERWGTVTRREFGVGKDPTDEELQRLSPDHPVFRITSS
ncbi:MAG: nitroreductase family deazaflavin-dependent oxidoreductase [Dehalococcoidia bacterium]